MNPATGHVAQGSLATLRKFVRAPRQQQGEVCELCAKPLEPAHQHLLELDKRRVACACDACSILFEGYTRQRFRRIPRDARQLRGFLMDDQEWESLLIPINLAFFTYNSTAGHVIAQYPSPSGVMNPRSTSTPGAPSSNAIRSCTGSSPMSRLCSSTDSLEINSISALPSINASASSASFAPTGTGSPAGRRCGGKSTDSSASWRIPAESSAVPDLQFQIEGVEATPRAATPLLTFKVRATDAEKQPIHSIALRVQAQIEPTCRRYTPAEQEHLRELFGKPERWSQSLHPLLWTNTNVNVPGFDGSTLIDIPVPCTFDFNVAVTKYIYGLDAGEIPVTLLFSGTIFHSGRMGLQIAQVPWNREACYRLPIQLWKEMMEQHYPNTAWLCLQRDVFDKLLAFKAQHGIPTWEKTFERMLGLAEEVKS